jgi:hypothetical protein
MNPTFHPNLIKTNLLDPIDIQLIRGVNIEGKHSYWYVALHRSMVKELFISLKCKTTYIEQYGVVLASGLGEPDEETKEYIHQMLIKKNDSHT